MKTILKSIFVSVLAINTGIVHSADSEAGKKVFMNNCSGCHSNGLNAIVPEKTLKKSALEKNGMLSQQAIIKQVTNGKSPMPGFDKILSPSDIENVASYVLKMANSDWK